MDSKIADKRSIEEEHYHIKNGIKTLCSEEAWAYVQNLPRHFLDASEKQILRNIYEYFTIEPLHWSTDPLANTEDTLLQNTETTTKSQINSEEIQTPTSTSRKIGRPKKVTPRLSWAEKLQQIHRLELEEDIVNLLGSSGSEDEIVRDFFMSKDLTSPRAEVRRLFRLLSLADIGARHPNLVKDKQKRLQLQAAMRKTFEQIDDEGRVVIGGYIQDILEGSFDRFQKQFDMARRLKRFCEEHGIGCLFYFHHHLDDTFIRSVTMQGSTFRDVKGHLQTLSVQEQAMSSGATGLGQAIRNHLLEVCGLGIKKDDEHMSEWSENGGIEGPDTRDS
ncbi:MAG: hypothetical protein LQ348_003698 [Seirophora lacunosa]|nr:MAG: hypothetical protein LQ348_003698 [Seirophora lacunosa]